MRKTALLLALWILGPIPARSLPAVPAQLTGSGHVYVSLYPFHHGTIQLNNRSWLYMQMIDPDWNRVATGRPKPNPADVSDPTRLVIPISTEPRAMLRMDVHANQLVSYGHVESNPYWMALDATGSHLYTTTNELAIDVYDTATMARTARIRTGGVGTDLVRSPDGRYMFSSLAAGTPGVVVIDAARQVPARFIPTPPGATPMAVAVNADSSRMYVSLSWADHGEVAAIDTVSTKVVGRCKVGGQPMGLALSPDGRVLFVANNKSASVSVVDVKAMSVLSTAHVGIGPMRVRVTSDGRAAYVTCRGGNCVSVINNSSGSSATIAVGSGPTDIALSEDGRAFVSNTKAGTISILSTTLNTLERTTLDEPYSCPFGVAIGP